jgi:MFS superfamily sulfate permease-like transporter
MIYRFMHNMYYANTQVLTAEIARLAKMANPPLKWFAIDGAAVNDVDFTAADALRTIHDTLAGENVRIVFCEITDHVMSEFDRSGLTPLFGRDAFFPTPDAVVKRFTQEDSLPP